MPSNLTEKLAALFEEAGKAHHQAFLETDGADPEWPLWYAEYLKKRLNVLLGTGLTKSEVVYHLLRAEEARSPEAEWQPFYADIFAALATRNST